MQRVIRSIFVLFLLEFFTVASDGSVPLPPWDDYLNLAKELYDKGDYGGTLRVLKKLEALQKESGFELIETLELMREVEGYIKAQRSADGNETSADSEDGFDNEIIKADGTCEGKPSGAGCWMELINHPECYVWNENLRKGEIMAWSGECSDGFAQGRGTLKTVAIFPGNLYTNKGEEKGYLRDGKRYGHWIEMPFDEIVRQGPYVNGKKNGKWIYRYYLYFHKLNDEKGPYVNGKRHGHWIQQMRRFKHIVFEGPYVDGKKHGKWVERSPEGRTGGGSYMNGKKHGQWVEIEWGDICQSWHLGKGSYVEGERHGHWSFRFDDGVTFEGPFVDDRKHGKWVTRDKDGKITHEATYKKGIKQEVIFDIF